MASASEPLKISFVVPNPTRHNRYYTSSTASDLARRWWGVSRWAKLPIISLATLSLLSLPLLLSIAIASMLVSRPELSCLGWLAC